MPILKNAKKKLKQDKKRTIQNRKFKDAYKDSVKAAKTANTPDAISKAFSNIDKAVKKNIIHKNKAAHLKSSLSKTPAVPVKKSTPVKKSAPTKKSASAKKSSRAKKSA